MKRKLNIEQGIIIGDIVRDILKVLPDIENRFRQRKTYDEYYFDGATIELSIDIIESLNQMDFKVSINREEVVLT